MNPKITKALILGAIGIVAVLIGISVYRGMEASERATVRVDDQFLTVRVADNAWERAKGLSGFTPDTVQAHGMLFIFPKEETQQFWMKGMLVDLDIIWIRDNKIVGMESNVPAPKKGEEPARVTSEPVPVDMVLELPAGSISALGLVAGKPLEITLP